MATSTPTPLRLSVREHGDVRVIELAGRLDQTFEQAIASTLERLMDQGQARVVVDLSGLEYLNSRGVSVFIAAVDDLRAAGGDLKMVGAPAQASVVLARLGVDRLLQQFERVDQAVEAFQVPIQEFLSEGGLAFFVVGVRSKTFHASSCTKVKKLRSVKLLPSKKAARDAGLRPCPKCCE
jgi:anti-sigma B factor antagonist